MKQVFKLTLLFSLLLAGLQSMAQEEKDKERKRYDHFKERNISKTYPASGNSLSIENQFGNVKVVLWDRNEIKVDIHIEASSTEKEWAERDFEKIDVKDAQNGSNISFVTSFSKENKSFSCNNCSNTLHIDYTVSMPASNKLSIENSFGDITIPDYKGPVKLESKYGSLTAGKMDNLERLEVEFGKATLKYLDNADVTFKYSTITIETLSGANTINMEFCHYSKINLSSDLTSLKLNDSYSMVHLRPAPGFSASYSVSTSYGSFVDKTGSIVRTD
ncbi:MAG TPA: hypothetical protein VMZ03_05105, partial [Chitinophagaceae bacterium]|nr:hypothetical protein [Chitinophagaceae bacterium]